MSTAAAGVAGKATKAVCDTEVLLKHIAFFVPNSRDPAISHAWLKAYDYSRTRVNADALSHLISNGKAIGPWLTERPHITHVDLRKLLVNFQGEETPFLDRLVKDVLSALRTLSQRKLQSLVLPHEAKPEDARKMVHAAR